MQLEHILQAHGLIGRGGSKSKDEIPPPPITNFIATVVGDSIKLTWTNPDDTDFVGVRIVRKDSSYPSSPSDGLVVYEGNLQEFIDENITKGIRHYYRAFTYDFDNNYNYDTGQQVNAIVKLSQTAPSAPTMASRTSTSITLNAMEGCEYRVGSGTWQDSTTFSGLNIATSYTFYARKKETDTHYASPASNGATFTTDKGTQSAPPAPSISNLEFDRVTVTGVAGTEVRLDNGTWHDSPHTFTGLSEETSYTAYARMKETNTHYASPISTGRNFTTPSSHDDKSGSPGSPDLIAGTMQQGFFGEVPSSELITGDALASQIGLSSGTAQFSNEPWLKFAYQGKIQFVAKKPFRYGLSWDDINAANAVYGDRTVTIGGLTYKVRLMRGANKDPAGAYDGSICHGSEWNRLMLPIHENAPNNWAYPNNVDSPTEDWGVNYTDEDLLTHYNYGDGSRSWCQEVAESASNRVYRGIYGVSSSSSTYASNSNSGCGWRPVLELVE